MTAAGVHLPLIQQYLTNQAELTAVERFAQLHESGELNDETLYQDRLPAQIPGKGEQYAFEVDLDACTGCKACVTACHRMNGLDEGETFRATGVLQGMQAGSQVTVTSSCHHCIEPACLAGCPVSAYEKDTSTGIVKHLDDQCIGCRYCMFTCPYDVPKFNENKGIVRKCDMCSDRLAAGEAPACVQACPAGAITIAVRSVEDATEAARAGNFLPGAPSPQITTPTTVYTSRRGLANDLVAADRHVNRPAENHPPLVMMLVLTQLAVGIILGEALLSHIGIWPAVTGPGQAVFALLTSVVALLASVLHLGRPSFAFRAVLGLRRSWLSREILAFGAFAGLAASHAALTLGVLPTAMADLSSWRLVAATVASVVGLIAIYCSVMVYHVTRRRFWAATATTTRFFGTTLLLGGSGTLCVLQASAALGRSSDQLVAASQLLTAIVPIVAVLKLAWECLLMLQRRGNGEQAASARLLLSELRGVWVARLSLGGLGCLITILLLGANSAGTVANLFGAGLAFATLLGGELLERRIFFQAVKAPKMPGQVGS